MELDAQDAIEELVSEVQAPLGGGVVMPVGGDLDLVDVVEALNGRFPVVCPTLGAAEDVPRSYPPAGLMDGRLNRVRVVADLVVVEVLGGVEALAQPHLDASSLILLAFQSGAGYELDPGALGGDEDEWPRCAEGVLRVPEPPSFLHDVALGSLGDASGKVTKDRAVV